MMETTAFKSPFRSKTLLKLLCLSDICRRRNKECRTPHMKPYIIGIAGGSGSGKTSLIRRIREAFSLNQVCIVSQDDYYKPRDEQEADAKGVKNFDLPKSIKKKELRNDLQRLLQGESVFIKEYVFNNDLAEPKMVEIKPAPVIVVEGLFVFHYERLAAMFDLKVFVEAKDPHKIARRIIRDATERNYPVDDVLYRYQYHVLPSYERYILPYKESADVVINNNNHFENGLSMLIAFIKEKVAEQPS
jgi:uridine kinase